MKDKNKELLTWVLTWGCLAIGLALPSTVVWGYKFIFADATQKPEVIITSCRLALILAGTTIMCLVWARRNLHALQHAPNRSTSQINRKAFRVPFIIVVWVCLLAFIAIRVVFQSFLNDAFMTWSSLGVNFDLRTYFWIQNLPLIYERLPLSNLPLLVSEIWLVALFATLKTGEDA